MGIITQNRLDFIRRLDIKIPFSSPITIKTMYIFRTIEELFFQFSNFQ